ncbi:hypothetical protein LTR36_001737 [Oleoguttula mirabilis]|uniref:Uncharacterized protein n=1 Tax=Oleoguttula mirabilis TaxID=1507867 RepID=A0AAV9JME8_9PEZI|nr:hypothetical protein LTR36_001737 [Oleoguttula mirabilis]
MPLIEDLFAPTFAFGTEHRLGSFSLGNPESQSYPANSMSAFSQSRLASDAPVAPSTGATFLDMTGWVSVGPADFSAESIGSMALPVPTDFAPAAGSPTYTAPLLAAYGEGPTADRLPGSWDDTLETGDGLGVGRDWATLPVAADPQSFAAAGMYQQPLQRLPTPEIDWEALELLFPAQPMENAALLIAAPPPAAESPSGYPGGSSFGGETPTSQPPPGAQPAPVFASATNPRRRAAASSSSHSGSRTGNVTGRTPSPIKKTERPKNRRGQVPGWAQALKQHRRTCDEAAGCQAGVCELMRLFPQEHQEHAEEVKMVWPGGDSSAGPKIPVSGLWVWKHQNRQQR